MKAKRGYSLENFYLYDGNRVAFLAAQKIIQFPGELFNPFYVYSGSGLGKTHLLWAIHADLSRKGTALFFTALEFDKWINSNPDTNVMLIIDDLHTLAEHSQERLLAIMDAGLANNRQLCFSGIHSPRDLKNLNPKIISRIEGGLTCDIQPPKELSLVDMIKRKAEESGIIIPDEIALELAQLSSGSIRTIEGMINRLVAYSSLGQFSLDLNTIRLILKEFYPRGVFSPVTSLIEELKKNAADILPETAEQTNPREEYKEKIYIWEMKGFDISSLKPYLEADLDVLSREYGRFIKKVETLIELQKEFGGLDSTQSPSEAMKIETMLFSPDRIEEIQNLISIIRMKSSVPRLSFANYLIGDANRTAYELYHQTILPNLGRQFNPMVIIGGHGVGKTHLLTAIFYHLLDHGHSPFYLDLQTADPKSFSIPAPCDVLLIDNFTAIAREDGSRREQLFHFIAGFLKNDRQIFIATEILPVDFNLTKEERDCFDLGIEVRLEPPNEELARRYIALQQPVNPISSPLPSFTSYYDIEEYRKRLAAQPASSVEPVPVRTDNAEAVIKPEITPLVLPEVSSTPAETISAAGDEAPLIPLGLPGESQGEPPAASAPSEVPPPESPAEEKAETPFLPLPTKPFKALKEKSLMIPGFINELIEENF